MFRAGIALGTFSSLNKSLNKHMSLLALRGFQRISEDLESAHVRGHTNARRLSTKVRGAGNNGSDGDNVDARNVKPAPVKGNTHK